MENREWKKRVIDIFTETSGMNVSVAEGFYITGISTRTSNLPGRAEKEIPALWARFQAEGVMQLLENRDGDSVYCVYTGYESDHRGEYDVVLGCRTDLPPAAIPGGFVTIQISAGPYEKFTATGNLMQGVVFSQWLKIWEAGLRRAFTTDYEVYDERAINPSSAVVDIFIALKA